MRTKIIKFLKSRKVTIGIIFASIIAITFIVGASLQATVDVDSTNPRSLVPCQIKTPSFDVRSEYGGTIIGSSTNGYWADPNHEYPGVNMFWGQPYISDAAGNPVPMTTFPAQMLYSTDSGEAYYLHQYYVTETYGIRTKSNFPDTLPTTAMYLNPFEGGTYSVAGALFSISGTFKQSLYSTAFPVTDTPNKVVQNLGLANGVLAIYVDATNPANGFRSTQGGSAQITQSLYPIEFNSILAGTGSAATSLTNAHAGLPKLYGAGKVYVDVKFDLVGLSDYLTYIYTQNVEFSNGTKIQVVMKTTSGLVGFENAYTPGGAYEGLIPNAVTGVFGNATGSISEPEEIDERDPDNDDIPYTVQHTATGSVEFRDESEQQLISLSADFPDSIGTSLDTSPAPQIDLNAIAVGNMTIPGNVFVTTPCTLQPAVNVKDAEVRVEWQACMAVPANCGSTITASSQQSKTLYYPFAISVQNVAVAGKATFLMNVVNKCDISANYLGGEPFNVSSLTDFELNEIVMHPRWDNVKITVEGTSMDWMAFWNNILGWVVFFLVVAGVIVVLILLKKFGLFGAVKNFFKRLFKHK